MKRVETIVGHLSPAKDTKRGDLQSNPTSGILYENRSNNKSKFLCTLDGFADKILTEEQREFYEENGFLVVRKLLSPEDVDYFYKRFDEVVENPKLRPPEMLVMRDIALKDIAIESRKKADFVTKLQEWSREEGLWKYAKHEKIVSYVKAICGENLRAMHFMVINKPPDNGVLSSRHPFHQDQWYFPFAPCDHTVCSWTALQRIDRSNGCLSVIPGSHHKPPGGKLLEHDYPREWHGPVNKAYHGVKLDNINTVLRKRVHLEMDAGDTVFFHPLLLHASGANLSHSNRRSISVHYASSTLCEYFNVGEVGQQKIVKELKEMGKKRFGDMDLSFYTMWAIKSRQVCGDEGNLKIGKNPKNK